MKVGLLAGREHTFPEALIDRINTKVGDRVAEMILLRGTRLDEEVPYDVIVDRISHEVPYYRAYLGKAVADGTIVINNPFWWSADNKFIECVIAERLGVAVPKTALIPNRAYEADIIDESLRNLVQPPPWDEIVAYTGLPAVLKPAAGGGSKSVTVVRSIDDLQRAWEASGTLQMILQEFIDFQGYVRCFAIGREHVLVSRFDISLPRAERYLGETGLTQALHDRIVDNCLTLTRALGYDMDTIELAIRDDVPYAIDFLNPAPDCDPASVTERNFQWVLDRLSELVIAYARHERRPPGQLSWQTLLDSTPAPASAR